MYQPTNNNITTAGLILTKIGRFKNFSTNQIKIQNSISTFFEKLNQIFEFPCCITCENLSIDVLIAIVGLILTSAQVKIQFQSLKKIQIPWCSTCDKTFPLMYQLLL